MGSVMEGPEKLTARSERLASTLLDTLAVPGSPVDRPADDATTRRSSELLKGLYARTGQQAVASPPKVTGGDTLISEAHAPKATGAEASTAWGSMARAPIYVVARILSAVLLVAAVVFAFADLERYSVGRNGLLLLVVASQSISMWFGSLHDRELTRRNEQLLELVAKSVGASPARSAAKR